jgi:uncharacterized membrane protein
MQDPEINHAYQGYSHTDTGEASQQREQQQPPHAQEMPYGQPVYQQPYPFTSFGAVGDGRLSALLSYSLCWFSGLLFLLFAGRHPYVRFHALQSLAFFGVVNLLDIGFFSIIAYWRHLFFWHGQPFVTMILVMGFMLLNIIAFVAWIVGMVQAGRGLYYRLPVIGDLVANTINQQGTVK